MIEQVPSTVEADSDRARLARDILAAVRRAERLGLVEAVSILRQAREAAERAAAAGRRGLPN